MKKRKGFTIVELVIVIAVIGILSAILIPSFANLINKAKESKDASLVRNLNMMLVTNEISGQGKKHNTLQDVIDDIEENGISASSIGTTEKDSDILWDQTNDAFCYYSNGLLKYVPETMKKADVPFDNEHKHNFWRVYNEMPETQTYSIYWNGSLNTTFDVSVGFDAGTASGVTTVNYVGNSFVKENVRIRTNSNETNLSISVYEALANYDTVYHYGTVGTVTVTDSGTDSYHEVGQVTRIDAYKGHVVIERKANVDLIVSFNGNDVVIDNNGGTILSACGEGHTTNGGNVNLTPFVAPEVDLRLIERLNTVLSNDNNEHRNMTEALVALKEAGYGLSDIAAVVPGNDILWDQTNDVFCYFNGTTIEYVSIVNNPLSANDYRLWKIYSEMPETQTYSIYWNGVGVKTVSTKVGFDVGTRGQAMTVKYIGDESTKDDVRIRTDCGALVLNNENDTINHYGTADALYTRLVGENKFTSYGTVHNTIKTEMRIGAKFAGTARRSDETRASNLYNPYFKAGTVIKLIDSNFRFNIVSASSEDDYNTGADTVPASRFIGGNTWNDTQKRFTIPTNGYYGFQFAGPTQNEVIDREAFVIEDVLSICYTGDTNNHMRMTTVEDCAIGQYYGYLTIANAYGSNLNICKAKQDGYIHDGKIYVSNGETGQIDIYNLADGTSLGSMAYGSYSTHKVHGNSVQLRTFGNNHYTYSNIYNSYANSENKRLGECCVYLTDLSNTSENPLNLVQIIKISFAGDNVNWPVINNPLGSYERPYGNFVIDEENNLLYAYVMDINNNNTKWFKFNLPNPTETNVPDSLYYNLTTDDILDTWTTNYMNLIQGVAIVDGLIYSLEGASGSNTLPPGLRIIDPELKEDLIYVNLKDKDYASEPELMAFYNDQLYFGTGDGKLQKLLVK